ncbi:MAG: hypothetical protein H6656_10155 [Ardenticatenaceae bacterium]|nr:hypothetical protein [Ardenticatenaceae bacterium]
MKIGLVFPKPGGNDPNRLGQANANGRIHSALATSWPLITSQHANPESPGVAKPATGYQRVFLLFTYAATFDHHAVCTGILILPRRR